MTERLKLATTSLCGCFGCHMSLLDIDERIEQLVELVEFDRSPLTDIKNLGKCDIGIIEGGVADEENIEVLKLFRKQCRILVATGACAVNGGIPAMRNHFSVAQCLNEAYLDDSQLENPQIPADPEIPLLLNQVHPVHELVTVDYEIPGCPPSADTLWTFLTGLINGGEIHFPYQQIRYD